MVAEFAAKHPGEVPRPEWWKGYAVRPERVELWVDGAHRLHDRFLFVREGAGWVKTRLFP
jgi:pyridoxamine 5'-phosphate oxidase